MQYQEFVYEIVLEYLNKNRTLEINTLIPYINARLSKESINLNSEGILKIIQSFLDRNLFVEGSKLSRTDILSNSKRLKIYNFIKKNPGVYLFKIMNALGVATHVVIWHLNMLEEFNFINKTALGPHELYYDSNSNEEIAKIGYYMNHKKIRLVIDLMLKEAMGYSKTQLSKMLSMHPNTIKKYILGLHEIGLIYKQKDANKTLWFLNKEKLRKEPQKEDIELEIKEDLCTVHKGPIRGVIYACPKCGAKYCLRCVKSLINQNEKCWICENDIQLTDLD